MTCISQGPIVSNGSGTFSFEKQHPRRSHHRAGIAHTVSHAHFRVCTDSSCRSPHTNGSPKRRINNVDHVPKSLLTKRQADGLLKRRSWCYLARCRRVVDLVLGPSGCMRYLCPQYTTAHATNSRSTGSERGSANLWVEDFDLIA